MKRVHVVLAAALLAGCGESPLDSTDARPRFSSQGVIESATGAGHFGAVNPGRRFAFSAVRLADGSVNGQFELQTATGLTFHGEVTCVKVIGKVARVGGMVRNADVPAWEGAPSWFTVVDNGEGNDSADQLTLLASNLNPAIRADLRHCDIGNGGVLRPIERGNIQVRP